MRYPAAPPVLLLALALATALSPSARADHAVALPSFGNWAAYWIQEADGKSCYMASRGSKSGDFGHGVTDDIVEIVHRPSVRAHNLVTVTFAYGFMPRSDVLVGVGPTDGTHVRYRSQDGGTAWPPDARTNQLLLAMIGRHETLWVKARDRRGVIVAKVFSLKSFKQTLVAINQACAGH